MKIAVVFDNMIYGGIERVGISQIKLLKELGHEVDAYVLTPKTEAIIDELKEICNVKILSLPRSHCPEAYWVITRRVRGGKYIFPFAYLFISLVHVVEKLFKSVKKEYDVAIAFSGHYNDLSFVANNFIKAKKRIAWLHGALYQYVLTAQGFENLYKKIRNLVVLVDDGQEEVIAYHKKDGFDFNIFKIYNPMSMSEKVLDYKKIDALKKEYGDFVLMVSRLLYPHKDHYTVISAVKLLKEKYGVDRKLLLVGDGPERQKLETFCKEQGMTDSVVFIGSQNDVQNYYKAAKVLAHASVAGEGLPTVLLEAMDLETPVVCTDSKVGPKEILGNNDYGLLTRVQDPDDMADKLYLLLTNEETYKEYQKQGKQRIKAFSQEKIKEKLKDCIEKII